MPLETQFGWKSESTWGTPVTPDRFLEVESFGIVPETERIATFVGRRNTRGVRADRTIPYVKGYAGPVKFPVLTKGFAGFIEHMLGATVSSSALVDSAYTHTYTLTGATSLCGKGFTAQGNMPLGACGNVDQAFTWDGGKVASWSLSCDAGGVVMCEAELVFENGLTATALATASYPTGMELLPFGASQVTIGGSSVDVMSWKVSGDNALKIDRHYVRSGYLRKEPVENGPRVITFECELDFDALATVYNRVTSATAAGATAAVVVVANGPTNLGTTPPSLTITMDSVRFDGGAPTYEGPEMTTISMSGEALIPASGTWLSLAYRTADLAP
jgi:hypothetical protein